MQATLAAKTSSPWYRFHGDSSGMTPGRAIRSAGSLLFPSIYLWVNAIQSSRWLARDDNTTGRLRRLVVREIPIADEPRQRHAGLETRSRFRGLHPPFMIVAWTERILPTTSASTLLRAGPAVSVSSDSASGSHDHEGSADPSPWGSAFWLIWSVVAAFGTYFCMYAYRKPFTAASYETLTQWGATFKTVLVTSQVFGYMVSKFIGIRFVSELPPRRRAVAILLLVLAGELALVLFGATPAPWNVVWLFFNGLPLGMVFGLVLGFLEGRRASEALTAGLCASFILADGVTKTVGAELLQRGVPEVWMPSAAGALFLPLFLLGVGMLSVIPPPSARDIAARAPRPSMTKRERHDLFWRYAFGLTALVVAYLLITIVRSIRADFAPELWRGLGEEAVPGTFTRSEMAVAFGVLAINGSLVLVRDSRLAFFLSLAVCLLGGVLMLGALAGWLAGRLSGMPFMVLIGLGLYLPYVAMHTTVFERLLAMTRDRGNVGFLMYLADSFGYLGYVAVMLARNLVPAQSRFLDFFLAVCLWEIVIATGGFVAAWWYFARRCPPDRIAPAGRN